MAAGFAHVASILRRDGRLTGSFCCVFSVLHAKHSSKLTLQTNRGPKVISMTLIDPTIDRQNLDISRLIAENAQLQRRLEEATETIRTMRTHTQERHRENCGERHQFTKESEARFREMIDALPTAIYTTDADGRLTYFNRACVDLSGRMPSLETDRWCITWKLYHPNGKPLRHDECPMAVALKTGQSVRGTEAIAERPDGTRIWFTPHPMLLRDISGQIVGGINMLVDITERKQSEEAILDSKHVLRDFVENATVAMHSVGPDGIILWANRTELELLGYQREEYVGRPISDFHEDPNVIADILDRLTAGQTLSDYEARLRCRDGSIRHVLINSDVLWDGDTFVHTRCVTRDITDRKQAEVQREKELADAELLQKVSTQLIQEQDADALYQLILEAAIRLMRADKGTIQLFDAETSELRLIAWHGIDTSLAESFAKVSIDAGTSCALALRTRRRAIIPDFTADDYRFSPAGDAHRAAGILAAQTTPLVTRSGELLGMMSTHWARPCQPDERALRMLDVMARQAADLIEQRRAEQALRVSEARLEAELSDTKLLQGLSAELVHEEDIDTLYGKITEAAVEIMRSDFASMQMYYPERGSAGELRLLASHGFSPEAVRFWGWVRADSACSCGNALRSRKRFVSPDIARCEFMQGTADQAMYLQAGLLAAQSTPLLSRSGKLLGMLSTHWKKPHAPSDRDLRLLDLLARQAADLIERKQAEDDLRASEQRFRVLFESMDEGYCVVEVIFDEQNKPIDYRFLETNPAFEKQTGIRDAKGRSMRQIAPTHEQHWFDIYGRIALSGETIRFENAALALERHYDVCAFRVGEPELRRVGIVFNDITERRRSEEAIRQSKDALSEADKRKDEFLATLAHELRNPLAPIRNSLHVLRLAGTDPSTSVLIHEMMERQVGQMVRLVDDLMEVSRITRGKIELRKERVDLAGVVQSAVETSKPMIESAHHQLSISLPLESLFLDADPIRVTQILANLLNNAAKYTEDGGQIYLTACADGPHALVSIRDTGMGIPAPMLPKVFDSFTQVDRTYDRSQGGLGIGLTLVRTLVELHGGTVEAHSNGAGQGSEFVVRLPLAMQQNNSYSVAAHNGRTQSVAARRILVVDDNRDSAQSLGLLLKFLGADITTANDGPSALEAIRRYRPSVVLLDIGMPGMDGYEVAQRARLEPEGAALVLIALTGWGQEEDRRRSHEAGFDHHLVKPVDLAALQAILAALDKRKDQDVFER